MGRKEKRRNGKALKPEALGNMERNGKKGIKKERNLQKRNKN